MLKRKTISGDVELEHYCTLGGILLVLSSFLLNCLVFRPNVAPSKVSSIFEAHSVRDVFQEGLHCAVTDKPCDH